MHKLVLLSLLLLACSDDAQVGGADLAGADLTTGGSNPDLSTVNLTPMLSALSLAADTTLIPGASMGLVATATYADATTKDVSAQVVLQTSDVAVATVNGAQVEGVAAGSAQITASLNGVDSAAVTITVKTVSSLAVTVPDGSTFILVNTKGPAVQFKAVATFSDSSTADVSANKLVVWASSASAVAAVSVSGLAMPGDNTGFTNIGATYVGKTNSAGMQVQ